MTSSRSKTAIDYIIIGLNPTLIVLMIASLVYFLTLCFYHGSHVNQINWILLLFTVAAVGIARIAIEEGRAHAMIFAIALGGATLISTARFVGEGMPMVIVLLILIWYMADRITIDMLTVFKGRQTWRRRATMVRSRSVSQRGAATTATKRPVACRGNYARHVLVTESTPHMVEPMELLNSQENQ